MRLKENRLSYWFPLLKSAGLPVPQTEIVTMSERAQEEIWNALDGKPATGEALNDFITNLTEVSESFSAPFFLRADETSAKHYWKRTCYVEDNTKLASHVFQIAEFCACADLLGLPFDKWAIREMLPTLPAFRAFDGEMPVTLEWRVFARDGQVLCWHPYWPEAAILRPSVDDWRKRLKQLYRHGVHADVLAIAEKASRALGKDAWSVDILGTKWGWYVIDVALARMSWHDEKCENDFTVKEVDEVGILDGTGVPESDKP